MLKSDFQRMAITVGVVGPPGADGPAGPAGVAGPSGVNGSTGPAGPSWSPVQSGTSPALVSGGTITTAALTASRIAPTAAATGVIMQAGTIAGQQVVVLNEGTFSATMAVSGTSNVATGTSCVVLAASSTQFVWSSGTSLWYPSVAIASGGPVTSTAYTMTGPGSGVVNVASTNFTVQVSPVGSSVSATVTITPAVSGVTGTFSPTSSTFTPSIINDSDVFTFTPTSVGTATISVTNSGGLSNPASLTYVVSAGGGTGGVYNTAVYDTAIYG